METKKTYGAWISFCALTLYLLHSITNGINPAMAALMEHYSTASVTSVTMISSIVMIGAVPGNIFCGNIINKIGFKVTLYGAIIVAAIGGLAPFFVPDMGIGVLIACRFLVGLAYGLFLPLGTTYMTATFEGDRRSRLLGLGSSFAGIAGMLSTAIGGALLNISLRAVYLYHLVIIVPPFLFALFLPDMPKTIAVGSTQPEKVSFKFNRHSWFYAYMQAICMLLLYPILVYISNVVVGDNLGTSNDSTAIMTVFTAASFICGFCYSFTRKLGERLIGAMWLGLAIAFACIAFGQNLILLYAGNIIAGFCYTTFVIYCMDCFGIVTRQSQVASIVGIGFAMCCIAPTVCVYFYDLIVRLFNQSGNFRFYFVFSAVAFAILGLIFVIKPKKVVPIAQD